MSLFRLLFFLRSRTDECCCCCVSVAGGVLFGRGGVGLLSPSIPFVSSVKHHFFVFCFNKCNFVIFYQVPCRYFCILICGRAAGKTTTTLSVNIRSPWMFTSRPKQSLYLRTMLVNLADLMSAAFVLSLWQ
ncbi:unnamed protein product [Laminaria digitata]